MKQYIVTAHLPIDPSNPIHHGDFALAHAEWTIEPSIDGARERAAQWRQHFRSVLIRRCSDTIT